MTKPTQADLAERLAHEQEQARAMGGEAGLARHRASGRLPVRERIDLLIDPESWFEIGALAKPEYRRERPVPGDAVVTGFGRIDRRQVGVIGIDSSVLAGTTAPISMRKQGRLIDRAQNAGLPLVLLCDADGGRIPDVMGYRFSGLPLDFRTFVQTPAHLPVVPRAAAILGPSYGDSALHASTAHFVVMLDSGSVALSGPSVVSSAINESLTDAELAGPEPATATGNAHMVVRTEADAMAAIAGFLSFLPDNAAQPAPRATPRDPRLGADTLADTVPTDTRVAYDVNRVIEGIADDGSLFPWAPTWGPSLVCTLGRIDGAPVGIIANQPQVLAGALDPDALRKERAFVDLCDTFNIPLLFLQDVPGLMIGTRAERAGILKAYEELVSRIANATVPKIVVILRKAYGGGHFAMGGRPTHPDFVFAWPGAEMGFMAPDAGARAAHRRELEALKDAEGDEAHDRRLEELVTDWALQSEPWEAAAHLSLDDIIKPDQTRDIVARAFDIAWGTAPRVRAGLT